MILKKWLKQMPTLGFNSSQYDLNLLEKHLIPILFDTYPKLSPIKKGNSFLSIVTPELLFLDFKNYLSPNYSLALFLKHYGASKAKGSFPYEEVSGVAELHVVGCRGKLIFYSSFKNKANNC